MASSAAPAAFSSTSCQVCAGRPAIPGLITVCRRSSCWRRRWCYEVQIGHFKAKAEDSLYDSPESRLIGNFGAKGRCGRSDEDLAVVEFGAQGRTGPARESDLVRVQSHQEYASQPANQARHAAPRWVV